MQLEGRVVERTELTAAQRDQMYALMTAYYCNVDRDQFACDLSEKQWVLLLTVADSSEVLGFSTLTLQVAEVHGRQVTALFSGDTIVHQDYWARNPLAQTWGRFALSLIDTYPNRELYWFLISKGYKTYRFLPLFFREFFPRFDAKTPARHAAIIHCLASARFGERFDSKRSIVRSSENGCHLRPQVADVDDARLRDPHVAHFQLCNPGHELGEELCCIAPLTRDNFTPAARRVIGAHAWEHVESAQS
ncbi:MAG: hypothetical protein KDB27_14500 [Planctomycetales bacterium]|nr:hypothetical protein [Planctomycetales bacterium]